MRMLHGYLVVSSNAFCRLLTEKRTLALLLLAALPVVFAFLQVTFERDVDLDTYLLTTLFVVLQLVVPLCALVTGVAVMGDEVESRCVTYLFTRPLPRVVIYLGRLAGHAAAGGLLIAVSVLLVAYLLAGEAELSGREIAASLGISLAGFLVYTTLFAALRLLLRRALFIGFILVVIFEGWVSKLPVSGFANLSVWHHLGVLHARLFGDRWGGEAALRSIGPQETAAHSLWVLAIIFVVSLIVGITLVQRREIRVPAAVA
jgi:ABC-type transport system involved in multi-copper enzyme maturation permease subunit